MEKMREEFEAWLCNTYEWAEETLAAAEFHSSDKDAYYVGGDYIYDGQSCAECLFWAWRGWQASRAAIEIVLPSLKQTESGERYVWSDGVWNFSQDTVQILREAGLKVRSE